MCVSQNGVDWLTSGNLQESFSGEDQISEMCVSQPVVDLVDFGKSSGIIFWRRLNFGNVCVANSG